MGGGPVPNKDSRGGVKNSFPIMNFLVRRTNKDLPIYTWLPREITNAGVGFGEAAAAPTHVKK